MTATIRSGRLRPLLLVLGALAILGAGASGAPAKAPAGGPIVSWGTPTGDGTSKIVIAGAIGDYGTSQAIDRNGKANPNGNYAEVTLQKGGFRVDLTAFNAAANKATFPFVSRAGCSSHGSITAPVTYSQGTGAYRGISGKGRLTLSLVWILSQSSSGTCDGKNVLFSSQYITGRGIVSFS